MKYKSDGTIDRCKARLIEKEFTQTCGTDYFETFSLIALRRTRFGSFLLQLIKIGLFINLM